MITSIHKSDHYDIYLCNDTLQEQSATITLSHLLSGNQFPICSQSVSVPPETSQLVYQLPLEAIPTGAALICDAAFAGGQDRAFYTEGTLPLIPCAAPQIAVQTESSITLTATSYIHAVELEGEFIFEDNYFSLLPGETRTIHFRPAENAQSGNLTLAGYTLK